MSDHDCPLYPDLHALQAAVEALQGRVSELEAGVRPGAPSSPREHGDSHLPGPPAPQRWGGVF